MGSFCGTNTQTVVQNSTNPNVTEQQNRIYSAVNNYAQRFADNPSALVAPWNPIQTAAAQGVSDLATANQPWNMLGLGMVGQGASTAGYAPGFYGAGAASAGQVSPIQAQGWDPTQYMSPYTQNVIDTTRANIEQSNQVAQNGALGNAIASGNAFGGDRAGVTMAELARNQGLAENQTLAALQQANFNQASQQANAQQQYGLNLGQANNAQLLQQGGLYGQLGSGLLQSGLGMGNLGYQLGNLANLGQQSSLGALQGLYNMGTGLQGTQQQQLSAPLTLGSWYGSASPGTGAVPTSTTYPGANPASTIAGLGLTGLAGASLLSNIGGLGGLGALFGLKDGGRVGKDHGGAVGHGHGGEEDDLVGRFSRMKQALHRDMGGGAGGPNLGVPGAIGGGADPAAYTQAILGNQPGNMQTADRYKMLQRMRLAQMAGQRRDLAAQSAALGQMGTLQGAAAGGAISREDSGGLDGGIAPAPTLGDMAGQDGGNDRLKTLKKFLDLSHKLTAQDAQRSPTQAPQAPGAGNWITPTQALSLGSLGGGDFARGGTIADLGRRHFDDGGGADADAVATPDVNPYAHRLRAYLEAARNANNDPRFFGAGLRGQDQPSADTTAGSALETREMPAPPAREPVSVAGIDIGQFPSMAMPTSDQFADRAPPPPPAPEPSSHPATRVSSFDEPRRASAPAPTPGAGRDFDPYRYMPKNSGTMALLAAGLGMLGNAGKRDAHGLPISGAAAIGQGGMQGVEYYMAQQKQALDALHAQQREAQLALAAAKNPAEIEHLNAAAALARTQGDKEFLLHIEKQKMEYQKQLEMEQMERIAQWARQQQQGAKGTAVSPGIYDWNGGQLTRGE